MELVVFLVALILSLKPLIRIINSRRNSGRGMRPRLLPAVVLPIVVIMAMVSYEKLLGTYVDWLWFRDVGYLDRFYVSLRWQLGTSLAVFLFSFVALAANSWYLATKYRGQRDDLRPLPILLAVGFVASILIAGVCGGSWFDLLTALKHVDFSVKDAVFGHDIGFYVFTVPAIEEATVCLRWILVAAAAMSLPVHLFMSARYGIEGSLRGALQALSGAAAHLMVLGALLVFSMIPSILVYMWELLYTGRGTVFGVGYVDEHIRIPALYLLMAAVTVSGVALLIFSRFSNRVSHRLLAFAVLAPLCIALLGLEVVPPAAHSMIMRGNELEKEYPYLARNIAATKLAYGLDASRLTMLHYPVKETFDMQSSERGKESLDTVRLWDWEALRTANTQNQVFGTYYTFPDTDVDRYLLGGRLRQVMMSVRELSYERLHEQAKKWQNLRLVYTHGYGACANDASEFAQNGTPHYLLKDIPPVASYPELELKEPRIYFGTETKEHVYVKTKRAEFDYQAGDNSATNSYKGPGGIRVDGFFRRLLLALELDGVALLTSDEMTSESRLLFRRDLDTRVRTIAPFLRYDKDPLRVIANGGIYFIWDAYTTTSRYPYSERRGPINYLRNSVKVTMNAYTGQVDFYVFDDKDPIVATYSRIFPGMFKKASAMPASLRQHVRYPEDLLALQGQVLSRYHMPVNVFYGKNDAWDVAGQIGEVSAKEATVMEPQYLITRLPGEAKAEFVLQLLFSPHSTDPQHPRGNLVAQLVGRCDGEHYGKLILAEFPKTKITNGPLQVSSRIMQHPRISNDITMWNQQGSSVIMRRMVTLPLDDGAVLYVQPIYMQSNTASMPELKMVAVVTENTIGYAPSFSEALAQVVGTATTTPQAGAPLAAQPPKSAEARLVEVGAHLKRYFELTGKGKAQEAGLELERAQAAINAK